MKVYVAAILLALCYRIGSCQTILAYGLTEKEKQNVVNIHNDYRKTIANGSVARLPRGTNLKRLTYDATLADEAQEIANTTVFAHVTVTDSRWSAVGQNIYLSLSTGNSAGSSWPQAIKAWYSEYTKYNYSKCCTSGTGHFTQVIWADTIKVGCGWTYYQSDDTYPYRKLYVCNYGPAGNYVDEYPYQSGPSGCENLCD